MALTTNTSIDWGDEDNPRHLDAGDEIPDDLDELFLHWLVEMGHVGVPTPEPEAEADSVEGHVVDATPTLTPTPTPIVDDERSKVEAEIAHLKTEEERLDALDHPFDNPHIDTSEVST
jgi:hypothetical protein